MRKIAAVLLSFALVFLAIPTSASNLQSPVSTVALSFSVNESITVTATPGTISFDGTGVASGPISVTTTWNVASGQHNAWVTFLYFSSSNALTNSGPSIPTSAFSIAVAGGRSGACNGSGTYNDGTGHTYTNPVTTTNNCPVITYQNATSPVFGAPIPLSGSQTDSVTPVIDSATASAAPAGSYTGTLDLIAVVQ